MFQELLTQLLEHLLKLSVLTILRLQLMLVNLQLLTNTHLLKHYLTQYQYWVTQLLGVTQQIFLLISVMLENNYKITESFYKT